MSTEHSDNRLRDMFSGVWSRVGSSLGKVRDILVSPPASVSVVSKRRIAQLTATISLILVFVLIIGVVASLAVTPSITPGILAQAGIILGLLIAYGISRTYWFRIGSIILVVTLSASGYGLVFTNPELNDISFVGAIYSTIPLALVISSALLPLPAMVAMVVINFIVLAFLPSALPVISFQRAGTDSGNILSVGVLLIIVTVFRSSLERQRLNESRQLNIQLEEANQELNTARLSLEKRVLERTNELEQRSTLIETAAEVGRAAASILDLNELISQVVELIRKRFNLYYVGLFLVDENKEWAVLRAGTGEAGKVMLDRGHRIKIGEGMIGWCVANKKARIAAEVGEDAVRLAAVELPNTRSEAALPLVTRDQILGALTVQSEQSGAFDQATITVMQTIADQVAIALINAQLYSQSQEAVKSISRAYGELTRDAWIRILQENVNLGYQCQTGKEFASAPEWQPEMVTAINKGGTIQTIINESIEDIQAYGSMEMPTRDSEYYLGVPIRVRDTTLGVFNAYKPANKGKFTPAEIEFLEDVTEIMSIALENARFFEEAQERAVTERRIGEISGRIRQTLDVDSVIQSAAREISRMLNLAEVEIRLEAASSDEISGDGSKPGRHA